MPLRALLVLLLLTPGLAHAQYGRGGMGQAYGKVVDADKKPVPFVSASVLQGDSVIGGALVQENGDFNISRLPFGTLHLKVSGMGYATLEKAFTLGPANPSMDLGNLLMEADAVVLQAAEIAKERATQVLQVDRRVYNVEKDLSVTGGDATDVMKNIPGLSVDADGNVEMRGKSPRVFVDGRPTPLTLEQIPAADIERVEVITNPSAAFDASTTGGIVNVVLKRSTRPGYSGQLQAGAGSTGSYNANGSLQMRQDRHAFTLNAGLGGGGSPGYSWNHRTDLADGLPTGRFDQDADSRNERARKNARIGWDWNLSNRNTISLSQGVSLFDRNSTEDQTFTTTDAAGTVIGSGEQHNSSEGEHWSITSRAGFKRSTTKPGKEWSTDLTFDRGENITPATTRQFSMGDNGIPPGNSFQDRNASGDEMELNWQLDVTDPYADDRKLEWGFKADYELNNSALDVIFGNDTTAGPVHDEGLSNAYRIGTWVNAGYVNWSSRLTAHWTMQAGLRVEQNRMDARRTDKEMDFSYSYPEDLKDLGRILFPSAYFSRKWDAPEGELQQELQVNVSRKVNRPNFWQLMPFLMPTDARSYRMGNPVLRPEMSTIVEVNHLLPFTEKGNWLSSVYGRITSDVITSWTAPLESDPNVLLTTFINGKQNQGFGWENTVKLTLWEGSEITLNGNVQWTRIGLAQEGVDYTNSGISFDGKVGVSQKLPKGFSMQANADYDGPRVVPQGHSLERYSLDFTVRKEFSKRFYVTAGANNILDSRGWGNYYATPYFEQEGFRSWGTREFRLNATWRFGKQDTSLFRRRPTGPVERREPGAGSGGEGEGL